MTKLTCYTFMLFLSPLMIGSCAGQNEPDKTLTTTSEILIASEGGDKLTPEVREVLSWRARTGPQSPPSLRTR